jgi:hypothetical protein
MWVDINELEAYEIDRGIKQKTNKIKKVKYNK